MKSVSIENIKTIKPVISRQSQCLSVGVRDGHQLPVGRGLSVGQLVDDVAGHDVLCQHVLTELVENVQLLNQI